MDQPTQLGALIDLAEDLGLSIREIMASRGDAPGGRPGGALVRVKGKEIVFLDRGADLGEQIETLAGALRGRNELKDRFIPPEIRQLIEQGGD